MTHEANTAKETHHYATELTWQGSTGEGYDAYGRNHELTVQPAGQVLAITADPAFLGDPNLLNPEQLLLAAASSCQLLSFLAAAARARINVVAYRDAASAVMAADAGPMRITVITLRPVITIAEEVSPERIARLVEVAHHSCFIANTVTSKIVIEHTVVRS